MCPKTDKQKVVLDADFFRHTTDHENNTLLLEKLLDEAGYTPIMHKYVADIELRENKHLTHMKSKERIEIVSEKDFLSFPDENYERYLRKHTKN